MGSGRRLQGLMGLAGRREAARVLRAHHVHARGRARLQDGRWRAGGWAGKVEAEGAQREGTAKHK